MHHITPVYTNQSDTGVGGYPLPMHRDPTVRTVRSEAATTTNKGSRSWFAPPQGTVKSHLVGMLSEFVGSTYLSLSLSQTPSLTLSLLVQRPCSFSFFPFLTKYRLILQTSQIPLPRSRRSSSRQYRCRDLFYRRSGKEQCQ